MQVNICYYYYYYYYCYCYCYYYCCCLRPRHSIAIINDWCNCNLIHSNTIQYNTTHHLLIIRRWSNVSICVQHTEIGHSTQRNATQRNATQRSTTVPQIQFDCDGLIIARLYSNDSVFVFEDWIGLDWIYSSIHSIDWLIESIEEIKNKIHIPKFKINNLLLDAIIKYTLSILHSIFYFYPRMEATLRVFVFQPEGSDPACPF